MTLRFALYLILLLSVFIMGMIRFNKLTLPFKLLTTLIGITFVSESATRVAAHLYHNALPLYHIISIIQYIFFALIYRYIINAPGIKTFILVTIFIMTFFGIVNAFTLQPWLTVFPSYTLLPSEILYCVYALVLFRQMLLNPLTVSLTKQSIFWYNVALILYSSVIFMCDGLTNYFISHHIYNDLLGEVNAVAHYIYYLLLGFSIFINSKQKAINIEISRPISHEKQHR
jgi:hypothetical protein